MVRERTPLWMMVYGVYVYLCSNSLRRASRILEPLRKRSYEAIRQWMHRLAPIVGRFQIDRRMVSCILVDETMIQIAKARVWLWVAFEPEHRAFLGFHISYHCNIWDAHIFLEQLRSKYGRKLIYTDDASWYPEACRWLRLQHYVYSDEWKNLMERMNQALKDRLECFDDYFPCWRKDCDRAHVGDWIRIFGFFYNYVRVHTSLEGPPVALPSVAASSEVDRFTSLIIREVMGDSLT
jgi:putative transposase